MMLRFKTHFHMPVMPERLRLARPRFADRAYRASSSSLNNVCPPSLWIRAYHARE